MLIQLVLLGVSPPSAVGVKATDGMSTKFLVGSEALSYLATLVVSWFIFPLFWKRPFAAGIQANLDAAPRNALRLPPIALILPLSLHANSSLISFPHTTPTA